MRPNTPDGLAREHYRRPHSTTYPRDKPQRAAIGQGLDRALRESLRHLRSTCQGAPSPEISQRFTDVVKGRHFGTLSLESLLRGAYACGAPLHAALQVSRAIESFTRAIWHGSHAPSVESAVRSETEAQGSADLAQVQAILSESPGTLDEAIERTAAEITAKQNLLVALVARRAEVE